MVGKNIPDQYIYLWNNVKKGLKQIKIQAENQDRETNQHEDILSLG
jgi:hypothetical protein